MPQATVSASGVQRFDLVSCPEGYVILRKMTYDQSLERRDRAMKVAVHDDGNGQGSSTNSVEMTIAAAQRVVVAYEFEHCIVEHNLEDENGVTLQFPRDMVRLDPVIGEEIERLIAKMNNYEEALKN